MGIQFFLQLQIAETERESQHKPGKRKHNIGRKQYSIIILNFYPVILCCEKDYSNNKNLPNVDDCHFMFCPTKCSVKYIITHILRQIQNVANSFNYVREENNSLVSKKLQTSKVSTDFHAISYKLCISRIQDFFPGCTA